MNNKLFYLTFIFLILSFITGYFAIPVNDELANIVDKRHQCSCSVFFADFDCKGSEGPAIGLMTFSQNELGHTTISGIFKAGFTNSTDPPKVTIEDHCGNEIVDISSLDIEPTDDNGTKSFRLFKFLFILLILFFVFLMKEIIFNKYNFFSEKCLKILASTADRIPSSQKIKEVVTTHTRKNEPALLP